MAEVEKSVQDAFNNVIVTIEDVYKTKLDKFRNISIEQLSENLSNFYSLLCDERLFRLFVNMKIKAFSSKDDESNKLSHSLFGSELLLKNVFNNQLDEHKLMLWDSLLNLYYNLEKNNSNNEDRLNLVKAQFNQIKIKLSDCVKEKIIPDDVNSKTSNMVNDIIGSFQNLMSENKNPFENIMNITTEISEKYYKDIEDGNIEVDKILKGMPFGGDGNMEGMGDMMKNMEGMMGDMVGNLVGGKKEEVEPTIIDDNFSTANVEIGQDELEKKGKGLVGNVMGMANNLPSMEGLPNLGELGDMMKDIGDLTSGNLEDGNLDNIKGKMDNFMENTLGIDMNEFNKNMENLVSKMESKNVEDSVDNID